MEAVGSSQTLVAGYNTALHHIPENSNLHKPLCFSNIDTCDTRHEQY